LASILTNKNLGIEDLCRIALESFGSQSNAAFSIFVNKNCLQALFDCSRNGDVAGPWKKAPLSDVVVQHHCSSGWCWHLALSRMVAGTDMGTDPNFPKVCRSLNLSITTLRIV